MAQDDFRAARRRQGEHGGEIRQSAERAMAVALVGRQEPIIGRAGVGVLGRHIVGLRDRKVGVAPRVGLGKAIAKMPGDVEIIGVVDDIGLIAVAAGTERAESERNTHGAFAMETSIK